MKLNLKQLVLVNSFRQLIKDPTRTSNTLSILIDVMLLNNEKNIAKSLVLYATHFKLS